MNKFCIRKTTCRHQNAHAKEAYFDPSKTTLVLLFVSAGLILIFGLQHSSLGDGTSCEDKEIIRPIKIVVVTKMKNGVHISI